MLARQARAMLVVKLLATAVSYGFALALARRLDAAQFGQVAVVLNAAFVLAVIGARGQHMALLRFIPSLPDKPAVIAQIRSSWRIAAVGTWLTLVLAGMALALLRGLGFLGDYPAPLLAGALALTVAIGWADFVAHIARGLRAHLLSVIPKEVLWRGLTIGLLLGASLGAAQSASRLITVMTALLICLTLGQWVLLRRRQSSISTNANAALGPECPPIIRPFWISSVANIFLSNADTVAVGAIIGPQEAGLYFVANRIAMALGFFQTSQNMVITPAIAENWAAGRPEACAAIARQAAWAMTQPTLVFGIAICIFAVPVLGLFGSVFHDAKFVLWLLVAAATINAAFGPGDIVLNMCGREIAAQRIAAVSLAFACLALCAATLAWGILGTGFAVLAATAVRKGLYWQAVRAGFGFRVDALALIGATHGPTRRQLPGFGR